MYEVRLKSNIADLQRLTQQYPGASRDARVSRITEAIALLEREVVRHTPRGAGPIHLGDTIHTKTVVTGMTVTGVVGTPVAHGEPVEFGTQPHFPPIGPLTHWVTRKLGVTDEDDAAAIAYAIAWKIHHHGTKGAHMFEKGFAASESRVIRILEQIPADIIGMVT